MSTILQRIARGETAAVQECLDRYGGMVWALVRRMLPTRIDAEDACQEIFIDIWRNAGRYDPEVAPEATFIAMIARRRLIDRQRRHARAPEMTSLDGEPTTSSSSPEERATLRDEADRVRTVMQQLRPVERQVLELVIDRGLTQPEVASALSLPLGTVKTHARRGLLQLRQLLSPAASGDVRGGVQ